MNKFPVARQIAWQSVISQIILMCICIGVVSYLGKFSVPAIFLGALIYIFYYAIIKYSLERAFSKGLSLINKGEFKQAIVEFETAYDFYSRYPWVDQWRFIFLHSSPMSYRAIALVNIAVCYSKI
jgi:hypothetical protein